MPNYSSTANVILSLNGKQAQQMLSKLQTEAKKLERQLAKAAAAGDKASMKKLQKELNSTNRVIQQMQGSAKSAEQVLARLDRATPKELSKTLRTLTQQLNGIERGSKAWAAQTAKIKAVKAEIARLNASLATQQSLWTRMNGWLNSCQTAILGITAAVSGLIMAGRKAVNAFADMEEAMANTRKYTRMTEEQVAELNDIFMKMDTRLAREQLNLLAQEGGRLGYNTVASVKEYVEAASIINVALVDLGEGATQTIAKLSNIFGMEQMYGVRESMLKIGSTVNHLSQNCTAAKPYLVNFAQRMAGIGATAKMSVPEILAFGATLDAHGQKVEMSATALQRTIMALFKEPAKMAQKVGLEAKQFTETLNKSTTDGVMMFLEALHKLGEENALAVLSPLFQDLGLDGVRVSSVLSNLSSHLDFLKWQLGEAAQAFKEGTSATKEYEIFNNTAKATIEKAKYRVHELAVELGEKLYPVMRHIYTSSSAFMRVLNKMVTFFIEHRKAIAGLAAVIAAYYTALALARTKVLLLTAAEKAHNLVLAAGRTAMALYRVAVIAFTHGLTGAARAMRVLQAAMSTNIYGIVLAAIAAIVVAIKALSDRTSEFTKKMREARSAASGFEQEMRKEMRSIDEMTGKLKACEKGTDAYKKAKDEILNQYGKYLKGLVDEKGEIVSLAKAYDRLAAAARIAAKERSILNAKNTASDAYNESMTELVAKLQKELEKRGVEFQDAVRIANSVQIQLQSYGTLSQELVDELQAIKGNGWDKLNMTNHPVNVVNRMIARTTQYGVTMGEIGKIERETNPLATYPARLLRSFIEGNEEKAEKGEGGTIIIGLNDGGPREARQLSNAELKEYIAEAYARLSALETGETEPVIGNPDFDIDGFTPYETEKEKREREKAERRAAIKAKKEFKEEMEQAKGTWEHAEAQNISDRSAGLKTWKDYLSDKHRLEMEYFAAREEIYKKYDLEEDEDYAALLKKKEEKLAEWLKASSALTVKEAQMMQKAEETKAEMEFYTPGSSLYQNEEALQRELYDIRIAYLYKMQAAYKQASQEWQDYQQKIDEAESAEMLRRLKLLAQRTAEWKKRYEYLEAKKRLDMELALLEEAKQKKLVTEEEYQRALRDLKKKYAEDYMPETAKPSGDSKNALAKKKEEDLAALKSLYEQGVIDEAQYEQAKDRVAKAYSDKAIERAKRFGSTEANQLLELYQAWKNFFDATEEDGGNWATRLAALSQSVFAVMNAGMQQASEFMQADADLQVAKTEKKYEREIEMAEGNSVKVKQLEKKKEQEIAAIKSEAARKQFAMQVIQAVAQTATNALNAYGSAAAVPVIGYILAPIAASMAVAAGAVQIATIKKQKEAADAKGYSQGGFTPDGPADEPAGIVHAGEWVASQKLTRNPRTRAIIMALDQAQRTNTVGSITQADVSRSIMAPAVLASAPQSAPQPNVIVNVPEYKPDKRLGESIDRLNDRLSKPIGAVVTVSGDHGIAKAQDEYDTLMRNKKPKSKR